MNDLRQGSHVIAVNAESLDGDHEILLQHLLVVTDTLLNWFRSYMTDHTQPVVAEAVIVY